MLYILVPVDLPDAAGLNNCPIMLTSDAADRRSDVEMPINVPVAFSYSGRYPRCHMCTSITSQLQHAPPLLVIYRVSELLHVLIVASCSLFSIPPLCC